ncbi:MAG: ribosome assembly factor SBDS [Candidatus Thermoplasmatota archaeon]|nr:ribosome assembly factor SBDS [Candidatus Thermoplasmatota archaeon]
MVSVDQAVIARLEKDGHKFEVLVDPEIAQKIKNGENIEISGALAIDNIFKDSKKGDTAAEENIKKVFGTVDVLAVAKHIIQHGEIQLTTDQRHKMTEAKRKQIVTAIARNAINPQTKAPHPPARIEAAMLEARVHVDPFKPVDAQIKDVLEALRALLPIRFENIKLGVKIPAQFAPKAYGIVKSFGNLLREEWMDDGSWMGSIEMPAGMQTEFYDKINAMTKGNVETKILK